MRNLRPCIKAAVDFVSPESVGECLALTQERRALAIDDKGWQEAHKCFYADKLQVEAMLMGAVAACVQQAA